jgi:hypothetical protein
MRVGDAIRYNPSVAVKGEQLWIYTFAPRKKEKIDLPKPLATYLTGRLKTAINRCEWLSLKRPSIWRRVRERSVSGQGSVQPDAIHWGKVRRRRLSAASPTGHVRRAQAVERFLLDDVSRLLGHSGVKVTGTSYAKWVASRKSRLERWARYEMTSPFRYEPLGWRVSHERLRRHSPNPRTDCVIEPRMD